VGKNQKDSKEVSHFLRLMMLLPWQPSGCCRFNPAHYHDEILRIQTGCSVKITGNAVPSPGKGQKIELQAKAIEVLGWADPETFPLQKKRHSFEFLRTIAHLRPRTNTFGAIARVRSAMSIAIHKFFQERVFFIYIHQSLQEATARGLATCSGITTFDLARYPLKMVNPTLSRIFFRCPISPDCKRSA
jgi:asparaginyl-tRNA synthetase